MSTWSYNAPALTIGVACNSNFGKGSGQLKGTLTMRQFKMKGSFRTSTDMELHLDFAGRYIRICKKSI